MVYQDMHGRTNEAISTSHSRNLKCSGCETELDGAHGFHCRSAWSSALVSWLTGGPSSVGGRRVSRSYSLSSVPLPRDYGVGVYHYSAGLLALILGGAGELSIDRFLWRNEALAERPNEHQQTG
jgi:hypothetical protein